MTSKNRITLACIYAVFASGQLVADEGKRDSYISYSFIEGAYVHDNFNTNDVIISDRDGVGDTTDDNFGTLLDATGNGGAGRFSVALFSNDSIGIHVVGDYVKTSHDVGINIAGLNGPLASGTLATNQEELRYALGFHTRHTKDFSFFAELGVVNSKASFANADLTLGGGASVTANLSSASGSRNALDARVGVRKMVSEHFELTGYARLNGNGKIVSDDAGGVSFKSKIQGGAGGFYHFSKSIAAGADYEFGRPGRLRILARLSF